MKCNLYVCPTACTTWNALTWNAHTKILCTCCNTLTHTKCMYMRVHCMRHKVSQSAFHVNVCTSFWIKKFIMIFVIYCKCQFFLLKCFLLKSHIKYHLLFFFFENRCSFRLWFLHRNTCTHAMHLHEMHCVLRCKNIRHIQSACHVVHALCE